MTDIKGMLHTLTCCHRNCTEAFAASGLIGLLKGLRSHGQYHGESSLTSLNLLAFALLWQFEEGNPLTKSTGQCLIGWRSHTTHGYLLYSSCSQLACVPLAIAARRDRTGEQSLLYSMNQGRQPVTWWFLFFPPGCSGHDQKISVSFPTHVSPKAGEMPAKRLLSEPVMQHKSFGATTACSQRDNNELRNSRTDKSGGKAKYNHPYFLPTRRRPNLNPVPYLLKGATKENNFEDFFAKIVFKGLNILPFLAQWGSMHKIQQFNNYEIKNISNSKS